MGTQVHYTPLYGAGSDGPVCGLLQVRYMPSLSPRVQSMLEVTKHYSVGQPVP